MAGSVLNLRTFDAFADAQEQDGSIIQGMIHVRIKQRTGRKSVTTVEGLPAQVLNLEKILKALKNMLSCNGNIVETEEHGKVIQLQGDHRESIGRFLIEEEIAKKTQIRIHGF